MKKQFLLFVIVALLFLLIGLVLANILLNRPGMVPEAAIQPTDSIPTIEPTLVEESTVSATDAALIKAALVAKYDWNSENIELTVRTNDGQYASGGVKEINTPAGGGMWFAAKVSGQWRIVTDGNGTPMCSDLAAYPDFPTSLIAECWDEASQKMLSR